MKFREFLQKILFRFFYIKNEKLKQFFISVFFIMIISFIILTIILIKQNNENRIKKNILEAVSESRKTGEAGPDDFKNGQEGAMEMQSENPIHSIQADERLTVYICGEVINPGVYEVDKGSRINDLIKIAGGISEKACLELINPAQKLTDGQKVYIPSAEERSEFVLSVNENDISDYENQTIKIININTASAKELETLPGIGSEIAARIVQYRELHGGFESIEALKNVSGIGEKKFNDIKEMITV